MHLDTYSKGHSHIKVGTDVEYLGSKDGVIVPLTPQQLTGTKEDPLPIGEVASLQLDNVLGEITFDPSDNARDFSRSAHSARYEVGHFMLEQFGMEAIYKPSHHFKSRQLISSHARVLGCKPDKAANVEDENEPVDVNQFRTLRTPGGHIHVSVPYQMCADEVLKRVIMMDYWLGAPLTTRYRNGAERRTMYGQAGRFRFTNYPDGYSGFEYRTPDCQWFADLTNSMADQVFYMVDQAMQINLMQPSIKRAINMHPSLCAAINNSDMEGIRHAMKRTGMGEFMSEYNPNEYSKIDYTKPPAPKQTAGGGIPNWLNMPIMPSLHAHSESSGYTISTSNVALNDDGYQEEEF